MLKIKLNSSEKYSRELYFLITNKVELWIPSNKIPYLSDYMMHRPLRHTQVLEEENRKKKFQAKNVVLLLPPVTLLHHGRPSLHPQQVKQATFGL